MSGQIWMSWPRVWEFHSPLCWLSHTRVVQIEWAWWKGSHSFFPLLMMIAIRNFWTRALANANSSSSFVFFWFQVKPVGWQLNYLISNCRAVLSSVLTVSKKNTHTHSLSLSLSNHQPTNLPSKLSSRYQFHPDSPPPFCHSCLNGSNLGTTSQDLL
jgi:hypothetical protein